MESIPPIDSGKPSLFANTFYTLRYRDFRLFWIALTVSLLGVSFQTVAQGWLVYRLTGSATMLGFTGFISAVLALPASLIGGVLADRVSRRNLVVVTQFLMIFPPIALAYLIWSDQVQVWHVIAATIILAIIAAVDIPSRTAMVANLVPKDDLMNAQGLASAVGQLTRIIGPAIAGVVIGLWGEAIPYFINGLSYVAMVVALLMMKPQPAATRERKEKISSGFLKGIKYSLTTPFILALLIIATAQGVFLQPYIALLPVFASDILRVGPQGLGWLNAAVGVGALIGAFGVANLKRGHRGLYLVLGSFLIPVFLIGFAWSTQIGIAIALLFLMGLGTVFLRTIPATYLLMEVPDELRGRVLSLATLIWYGAPYAAGLPIGFLSDTWGISIALSLTGVLFLATMIGITLTVPRIRKEE